MPIAKTTPRIRVHILLPAFHASEWVAGSKVSDTFAPTPAPTPEPTIDPKELEAAYLAQLEIAALMDFQRAIDEAVLPPVTESARARSYASSWEVQKKCLAVLFWLVIVPSPCI